VGFCHNDNVELVRALLPVLFVRLYTQVFVPAIKEDYGSCTETEMARIFELWLEDTVFHLPNSDFPQASRRPVQEWERCCRLLYDLLDYFAYERAVRAQDHSLMMSMYKTWLPIVCGGSFSVYCSVLIDMIAHYEVSSERQRWLFLSTFTVNYAGGAQGGVATDAANEYDNKRVKQLIKRNPKLRQEQETSSGKDIFAVGNTVKNVLTQDDRDLREALADEFPALGGGKSQKGKVLVLSKRDAADLAVRKHWRGLYSYLEWTVAKHQTSRGSVSTHLPVVKEKLLRKLYRGSQFRMERELK
jgi:hypothetical protein